MRRRTESEPRQSEVREADPLELLGSVGALREGEEAPANDEERIGAEGDEGVKGQLTGIRGQGVREAGEGQAEGSKREGQCVPLAQGAKSMNAKSFEMTNLKSRKETN